jgi:branched-chain amino acid transport system permease protein
MTMRSFAIRFPTSTRLISTVLLGALAIAITFILTPLDDSKLAGGAAMSIVILGLSWLIGWSGQVSLGNAGFMAIGAYATAIWANHHTSSPIIWSLVLSTVLGGLSGLVLALPATRLRGPYLAGMTLAFSFAVAPLAINSHSLTGGSGGLFINFLNAPAWFAGLFSGSDALIKANAQWPADVAIAVAAVAFFFMANLFRSRTGRAMRLVRDNEVAAELAGVNLQRTRTLAFVISAAYAGLGGSVMTLLSGSVTPQTYGLTLSILLLTLMVLGGIGTLTGAVIGGLIYSYSDNIVSIVNKVTGVNPTSTFGANLKGIVFGVLLILTMMLAPRGLVGLGTFLRRYLRR